MQPSDKYNEGVEVVLRRSWRAELFVTGSALATAVLLACLPLELELQATGLAWIALSSVSALRRVRPGTRLRVGSDGDVVVNASAGRARDGSFVAPWLVVLRWRPDGAWRDRSLLVAPDMLGADDFRRLRVLMRWG
jgi:hypothetical protein